MMANQPLWRECVEWLDRWGVLRSEDFPPEGELIAFGRYVRDGVVLCRLVAKLDPSALDFRLVCQNTFMSQVRYLYIINYNSNIDKLFILI